MNLLKMLPLEISADIKCADFEIYTHILEERPLREIVRVALMKGVDVSLNGFIAGQPDFVWVN